VELVKAVDEIGSNPPSPPLFGFLIFAKPLLTCHKREERQIEESKVAFLLPDGGVGVGKGFGANSYNRKTAWWSLQFLIHDKQYSCSVVKNKYCKTD
jgi:hypothetical protein